MYQTLIHGILNNDHGSIAKVISLIENDEIASDVLSKLYDNSKKSIRVGITGPPGAGKSTITNALIEVCLANKKTVGVKRRNIGSIDNFLYLIINIGKIVIIRNTRFLE